MLNSMKLCVFVFGQHYVLRLSADQWFGCWKLCLQSNIVRKRFSLFKKRNVKNLSVSEKKAPGLPLFLPVLLFQVGLCGIDLFSLAYVRARAAQEGGSSQLCRHTVVFRSPATLHLQVTLNSGSSQRFMTPPCFLVSEWKSCVGKAEQSSRNLCKAVQRKLILQSLKWFKPQSSGKAFSISIVLTNSNCPQWRRSAPLQPAEKMEKLGSLGCCLSLRPQSVQWGETGLLQTTRTKTKQYHNKTPTYPDCFYLQ